MSKIRILPDNVVNQIAAGEVIERPAAVVKELIENSLDAQATRIEVEFSHGGKLFITIEDNGCGMTPNEALLCLERHATSKLRATKDLENIYSFGFRGEAIPSVASVSKFTLRTRGKDCDTGCEILINGGKIMHRREFGMAQGTRIEVANLFNSVPVRRKFMKTDNTEAAHIIHLMRLYAVSNPHVAFRLLEDGREIFKSLPTKSLKDRIRTIWSKKLTSELIAMEAEEGGMRVRGLIGKPGVARSTRAEMVTLVNGRPVDSKTLNYALIESYHTYIPKGRYPVAFLFLEIDPSWVDVNVHPAKREVRFRQEGIVRQFVIQSVLGRLREATAPEPMEVVSKVAHSPTPPVVTAPTPPRPITSKPTPTPIAEPVRELVNKSQEPKPKVTPTPMAVIESPKPVAVAEPEEIVVPEPEERRANWRFIGRVKEKYGLFESGEGLVLLNIRAAHERVWYERIERTFSAEASITKQPLLFPVAVELDALKGAAIGESLELLHQGGFDVVEFGRNFYRIEAVPEWMNPGEAEGFLRDTAALIVEEGSKRVDLLCDKIAKIAVTHGVKVDAQQNDQALQTLVVELLKASNPHTSPFGKRIYIETGYTELERKLG